MEEQVCEAARELGRLRKRWLFLVLVTDIIIPLGLILLLIQKIPVQKR
ncbi:hypothetical protein F444_07400 [Phytophthora nicotianae P1976]|uniref:Uncharacterized protein n=1 Tax=Phytophthora nicotianae P1976 TaxID=1317066 RepID=A0A081AET6_PHYNI|nr:hypothetical protein F444_07400 [Phytophthora nicotianae P1976]